MQKYIRQSRVSSCIDIFYRGISSLQLWISLGPIETGDLGRHKRVVVIDEFGRQGGLHRENKGIFFDVP